MNRELEITPRRCEAGLRFRAAGIDSGCTGRATSWHELRKRSSAGSIVDRENTLPVCPSCNGYIEDHPDEAREAGLVTRSGDDAWDRTSVRNDRV